jgi:hypothetical protein
MRTANTLSLRTVLARDRWAALGGDYEPTLKRMHQSGPVAVLGRDPGVHWPVPGNPHLDLCHARFEQGEEGWTIMDLGSAAGTSVGGVPLRPMQPRHLPPRALVEAGGMLLETTYGVRPFERWANDGRPDIARASLLGEKARRDFYPVELLVVEGPTPLRSIDLRPSTRGYRLGKSRICEAWLPHESIADEVLSIVVTEDHHVMVIDREQQPVYLGPSKLDSGRVATWAPLASLSVGPFVFALVDPLAVALEESIIQPERAMTEVKLVRRP